VGCAAGLCSCDGRDCAAGERCNKLGVFETCGCNGKAACQAGNICCPAPGGCVNTNADPKNCGACGRTCAVGSSCKSGTCTAPG
jgi:hypothetical protein